jgi:hypothetical protein
MAKGGQSWASVGRDAVFEVNRVHSINAYQQDVANAFLRVPLVVAFTWARIRRETQRGRQGQHQHTRSQADSELLSHSSPFYF